MDTCSSGRGWRYRRGPDPRLVLGRLQQLEFAEEKGAAAEQAESKAPVCGVQAAPRGTGDVVAPTRMPVLLGRDSQMPGIGALQARGDRCALAEPPAQGAGGVLVEFYRQGPLHGEHAGDLGLGRVQVLARRVGGTSRRHGVPRKSANRRR